MIVVKIQGVLGNQISQYAMSRWLQNRYPKHQVKLDVSWCDTHAPGFELVQAFDNNKLHYTLATPQDVFRASGLFTEPTTNKVWAKGYNKLARTCKRILGHSTVVCQQISSGYPETQQLYHLDERGNWYINGFWHNWDYTHILAQLQSELVYNPWNDEEFVALQAEILRCNGVAVHIRLSDYSGSEHDILPTSNYYADALKYVLDEIANPVIYLFSDEPDRATKYMQTTIAGIQVKTVKSQSRPPYTDMVLMSLCKAVLCANSTYSYWAALLGYRAEHIITIPEYYAKDRKMWRNGLCITIPLYKLEGKKKHDIENRPR